MKPLELLPFSFVSNIVRGRRKTGQARSLRDIFPQLPGVVLLTKPVSLAVTPGNF
ncbi:MAG: hypothetical protein ABSD53_11220 [Terriglobales bacterium]